MSLVRGIRFLSSGYARDFSAVPDSEENIATSITLETQDDGGTYFVKLNEEWPMSIILDARMHPLKIKQQTVLERLEDNISLGKNNIYENPRFDSDSSFKNSRLFCAKIIVFFEKTGEYFLGSKNQSFMGESFDEYSLVLDNVGGTASTSSGSNHPVLFEKKFPIAEVGSIVEKYVRGSGKFLQTEGASGRAQYRFYPYGGFYEYGAHPQSMESCVFHSTSEGRSSCIHLSKLSGLKKFGINPDNKVNVLNESKVIFMHTFTTSQKMTLYDEIKNNGCKIQLTSNRSGRSCAYVSSGLLHIPNTDLIRINFIPLD
jgi:hypothetical protein